MQYARIAVTGGAGRLGIYVAKELREHAAVTTIDISPAKLDLPHVEADIRDLAAMHRAIAGHDAVMHIGAIDGHVEATDEDFFVTNAQGTWNVLHAAFEAGVKKVIVCSSNASTGLNHSNMHMPPLYLPIDETHERRPTNAYGLSKLCTEVAAQSFGRRGKMKVATIRPVYIMFPELVQVIIDRASDPEKGDFPSAEERAAATSEAELEPLTLLRSWVRPEDLARAFRLALETDTGDYDMFYATAADTFEPEPTLPYMERVYGTLPDVRKPEIYERNPHASPCDSDHAREVLGWEPTGTWEELSGMKRA